MDNLEANVNGEGFELPEDEYASELEPTAGTGETDPGDGQPPAGDAEGAKKEGGEQLYEVNGEKLTLDELRKGYLRQQDYTKKTTEVARIRRGFEEAEQERILQDFYARRQAPAQKQDTPAGDLTDEDIAVMDPVARKAYEAAQKALEIANSARNEVLQRQIIEHRREMSNTLDGFVTYLEKEKGYDRTAAEEKTAEIAATVRSTGAKYNMDGFKMIFNGTRDVDAEAERLATAKFEAWQKQKAADAAATGMSTGSASDGAPAKLDLDKLRRTDPDAYNRALADLL